MRNKLRLRMPTVPSILIIIVVIWVVIAIFAGVTQNRSKENSGIEVLGISEKVICDGSLTGWDKNTYDRINHFNLVAVGTLHVLASQQLKANLDSTGKPTYGRGSMSKRPVVVYAVTFTCKKSGRKVILDLLACYTDDLKEIMEKYKPDCDPETGICRKVDLKALREELRPKAQEIAEKFFELIKDKIIKDLGQ